MKSECAVRAALRPTVGPFRAVMRSLGCVAKAWVVCWGNVRLSISQRPGSLCRLWKGSKSQMRDEEKKGKTLGLTMLFATKLLSQYSRGSESASGGERDMLTSAPLQNMNH